MMTAFCLQGATTADDAVLKHKCYEFNFRFMRCELGINLYHGRIFRTLDFRIFILGTLVRLFAQYFFGVAAMTFYYSSILAMAFCLLSKYIPVFVLPGNFLIGFA